MLFPDQCAHMSSSGDMKMSLKLMTLENSARSTSGCGPISYIFMPQMLKKLQFSVCPLGQDRSAEGFHDLLDRHSLVRELILC